MKGLASSFIKLFNKVTTFDKRAGIHNNGIDNNYPELVESRVANSVTALRCKNLMAGYISGKGFGDPHNKLIVNKKKQTTLLQLVQDFADSISEHGGAYIHMNKDLNNDIKSLEVLPFSHCRVGKKDDDEYNGKIVVCTDWSDNKKVKTAREVDVYNPSLKVLEAQVAEAGSINKHNGQILYFKFGKYTYPLSPLHPCLDDAESEQLSSIFKNTSLKKGFFGKTLVVTKPLIDPLLEKDDEDYESQRNAKEDFKKTIQDFIGAENSDGVLHLELEFSSDKLEDEIMFKNIESNIDDKLFAHTENSVKDNIRMCFNNVPAPLIQSQDGALFGSSGDAIKAMKIFYQDQTNDERMITEQIIASLMARFVSPARDLRILPLIEITEAEKETKDPEEARKQAQATLKGSVGGVTSLLQIQVSVSEGKTDRNAALTIIEEIFGINRELASEMLGTPKEDEDAVDQS